MTPRAFALLAVFLILAAPVLADKAAPILYSRTQIIIERTGKPQPDTEPSLPWQTDPGILFDVELRDAALLYRQEGWFSLSGPSESSGVLLAFSAPAVAPIVKSTQYAPLDVLFIDKEGKITQIMPNLSLANIENDIYPEKPALALLFLAGGTCEKNGIRPGDRANHSMFKKPPAVLTAPE